MEKNYTISLDLYKREAIEQAISDFWDIASMSLLQDEITIVWENSEDTDEVFHEFMNYVLSL